MDRSGAEKIHLRIAQGRFLDLKGSTGHLSGVCCFHFSLYHKEVTLAEEQCGQCLLALSPSLRRKAEVFKQVTVLQEMKVLFPNQLQTACYTGENNSVSVSKKNLLM